MEMKATGNPFGKDPHVISGESDAAVGAAIEILTNKERA